MFHEYRDLITELKGKNARFDSLFEKHDELDHKIADAQAGRVHMSDLEIDAMKKEKLRIKDELGTLLARLISPLSFNPCLEFSNRNKFSRLNLPRTINKNSAPKRVKIYTARFTILTPLNNFYVSLHHCIYQQCGISAIKYNSLRLSIALSASKNISC